MDEHDRGRPARAGFAHVHLLAGDADDLTAGRLGRPRLATGQHVVDDQCDEDQDNEAEQEAPQHRSSLPSRTLH